MGRQKDPTYFDITWGPGWFGCERAGVGCARCFSEAMSKRNPAMLGKWGPVGVGTRVMPSANYWKQPLKWDREAYDRQCLYSANRLYDAPRPRVLALRGDPFEDWCGPIVDSLGRELWTAPSEPGRYVPWRDDLTMLERENIQIGNFIPATVSDLRRDWFALIDRTPNLDWILTTKRWQNMRAMVPRVHCDACGEVSCGVHKADAAMGGTADIYRDNLWLGVSVSTQADLDAALPYLLACRPLCRVLWISAEPLLGELDIVGSLGREGLRQFGITCTGRVEGLSGKPMVDFCVVGGESGPHYRDVPVEAIESVVRQCRDVGVKAWCKQDCGRLPGQQGRISDEIWAIKELPR